MATTERMRRNLYDGLENTLGPEQADTLMQLLPHQPADELVTISYFQTEMAASRAEIRAEMADLRTELKGEMSDLRTELKGEMSGLRTELKGDMSGLRTELKGDMADLRAALKDDIASLSLTVNRRVTAVVAANVVAVVTALVT